MALDPLPTPPPQQVQRLADTHATTFNKAAAIGATMSGNGGAVANHNIKGSSLSSSSSRIPTPVAAITTTTSSSNESTSASTSSTPEKAENTKAKNQDAMKEGSPASTLGAGGSPKVQAS